MTKISFLPSFFSVDERIQVSGLSDAKLVEKFKVANFSQSLLMLQDLLAEDAKINHSESRNKTNLATRFFLKLSDEDRQHFLNYVVDAPVVYENFCKAMLSNYIMHQALKAGEKKITELTPQELADEKRFASSLNPGLV